MEMLKKILCSLFLCFSLAGLLLADNKSDLQVYGVYSDIYAGVTWGAGTTDDVQFFAEYAWGAPPYTVTNTPAANGETMVDGQNYYHVTATNAFGDFFINFANWSGDMHLFMGGQIEFWVRSSSSNVSNIGDIISFGFKCKNSNNVEHVWTKTLNQLAAYTSAFSADGKWHKFIIPLREDTFGNPADTIANGLNSVSIPLYLTVSAPVTFDFDRVLWLKPNQNVTTGYSIQLKNRQDSSAVSLATPITWSTASITLSTATPNLVPANQYLEINVDYISSSTSSITWKLKIYTDSKTAGTSNPFYAGTFSSTSTPSGLICEQDTNQILPMKWRATSRQYYDMTPGPAGTAGLVSTNIKGFWGDMRDKSTFPSSYTGDDIILADMRGIHSVTDPNAVNFTSTRGGYWEDWGNGNGVWVTLDGKIRVYFMADFANAAKGRTYTTKDIAIEFQNE